MPRRSLRLRLRVEVAEGVSPACRTRHLLRPTVNEDELDQIQAVQTLIFNSISGFGRHCSRIARARFQVASASAAMPQFAGRAWRRRGDSGPCREGRAPGPPLSMRLCVASGAPPRRIASGPGTTRRDFPGHGSTPGPCRAFPLLAGGQHPHQRRPRGVRGGGGGGGGWGGPMGQQAPDLCKSSPTHRGSPPRPRSFGPEGPLADRQGPFSSSMRPSRPSSPSRGGASPPAGR